MNGSLRYVLTRTYLAAFIISMSLGSETNAQTETASPSQIVTFTTKEDHENMKHQLGIMKLRPGPSGNPSNDNAANYDESKANPYPQLPEFS